MAKSSALSSVRASSTARPAAERRARMVPLPPVFPHAWAVAHGEDRFGLWQAFEIAGVRQVMRWIPPGRFQMGSPKGEAGRMHSESPQHLVRLTQGHWLADTACTQALWVAVMAENAPSKFNTNPQCPVEQVSWFDVVDRFLPQLNARLPGLDLRLPTEAEWEYACRGDAERSSPFWFGDQVDSTQVNFGGKHPMPMDQESSHGGHTVPVKAMPCNGWGLYQMHGNVWEWCADWFSSYSEADATNPTGPLEPPVGRAERVLRGGSWLYDALNCRSAYRNTVVPSECRANIGFRLARSAS